MCKLDENENESQQAQKANIKKNNKLFNRIGSVRKLINKQQKNKDKIYRSFLLSKNKHSFPKSLFLIIILSLFLNICGILWGLPSNHGWAPDEVRPSLVISGIRNSFSHGWHNTYLPFHFYTLAFSYSPFLMLHRLHILDVDSFEIYNILRTAPQNSNHL